MLLRISILLISILSTFSIKAQEKEAKAYSEKAKHFKDKHKYDSAFYYVNKAIKTSKKNSKVHFKAQNTLVRCLIDVGREDQAENIIKRLKEKITNNIGKENNIYAETIYNEAIILEDHGFKSASKKRFSEAYSIRTKILKESDVDLMRSNFSLSLSYRLNSMFDSALYYNKKVLLILKKHFANKPRYIIATYNSQGAILFDKKEFKEAEKLFIKALNYLKKEKLHPTFFCQVYRNLGNAQSLLSKPYEALSSYRKALEVHNSFPKYDPKGKANTLNLYASALMDMGKKKEALKTYLKAEALMKKIYGEFSPILLNLKINKTRMVDNNEEVLKEMEEIIQKGYKIKDSDYAEQLTLLAQRYFKFGRSISKIKEGKPYIEKGFELALKANNYFLANENDEKGIRGHIKNYFAIGNAYYQYGKQAFHLKGYLDSSLYFLDKAKKLIENKKKKQLYDASKYNEQNSEVYSLLANVLFELDKNNNTNKYIERLFILSEQIKSNSLKSDLQDIEAKKIAGIPSSVLKEEEVLNTIISNLKTTIPQIKNLKKKEQYTDSLLKMNFKQEKFIKKMESEYPKYYSFKYSNTEIDIKQIQKSISKEEAIISQISFNNSLINIFITKKSIQVNRTLSLPSNKIDFEKDLSAYLRAIKFKEKTTFGKTAHKLYKYIFKDIELSEKIKTLVIIPDGNFNKLPFECLLTKAREKNQQFSELEYLINKYNIRYSFSSTFLDKEKDKTLKENTLLAVAPVFDYLDKKEKGSNNTVRSGSTSHKNVSVIEGTLDEVNALKTSYKSTVLTREEASESKIKNINLSDYEIIHFATHGFASNQDPNKNGIILAFDKKEDGLLLTGEIYSLKLNCKLLTLSACETGKGKIQKGEGVRGLSQAFAYAGAENMIVSYWKVNDLATAELMKGFYYSLKEEKKYDKIEEKLRDKKIEMIKNKKYAAPFYWAPFILIEN